MEYSASLDKIAKYATIAVFILVGSLMVFAVGMETVSHAAKSVGGTMFFGITVVFLVLMVTMRFRPTGYAIKNNLLIIHQSKGDKEIPLSDLKEVRLLDDTTMRATIRTFGSGGFFGYFGKFYNFKLGNLTLYATQRKNMILFRTNVGKQIVISPDDLSMLDQLRSMGVPVIN